MPEAVHTRQGEEPQLADDSGVRLALVALATAIRHKGTTPARLYTAERTLILAVEHVVAEARG